MHPTRENYDNFMKRLVQGLAKIDGTALMVYGSYVRDQYVPGVSDVDALLVFDDDVVIDKGKLAFAAAEFAEAQEGNNIPFQVTVSDRTTLSDKRFNPYNASFKAYFERERRVLLGEDPLTYMRFERLVEGEQNAFTFNLRKSRQGLFLAEWMRRCDERPREILPQELHGILALPRSFKKSLDAISRGTKQILYLMDGEVRPYRFSALEELPRRFPSVSVEPLREIQNLYSSPLALNAMYEKPEQMTALWKRSLTMLEEIIAEHIRRGDQIPLFRNL